MTSCGFIAIMIIGSVLVFFLVSFSMMVLLDNDDAGWISGIIAFILFMVLYANLTPSNEQMIENDYYAMLEDRPKCIDAGDVSLVSLGCKIDYIDWQRDSIEKQHIYDSVKVKLDTKIIKNVTTIDVKQDTFVSDTIKSCIEQCWNFVMNSDIKKCQDDCFK